MRCFLSRASQKGPRKKIRKNLNHINPYWRILENASRIFSEISVFRIMSQTVYITEKLIHFFEVPILGWKTHPLKNHEYLFSCCKYWVMSKNVLLENSSMSGRVFQSNGLYYVLEFLEYDFYTKCFVLVQNFWMSFPIITSRKIADIGEFSKFLVVLKILFYSKWNIKILNWKVCLHVRSKLIGISHTSKWIWLLARFASSYQEIGKSWAHVFRLRCNRINKNFFNLTIGFVVRFNWFTINIGSFKCSEPTIRAESVRSLLKG